MLLKSLNISIDKDLEMSSRNDKFTHRMINSSGLIILLNWMCKHFIEGFDTINMTILPPAIQCDGDKGPCSLH